MATMANVTVTFNYGLNVATQFHNSYAPQPFSMPMPFLSDTSPSSTTGTTANLAGVGASHDTLSVGQFVSNPSPGAGVSTAFTTVDVPLLLTAVQAAAGAGASIVGPVTFRVTATSYVRWAVDPFTAGLIPVTWSTPGLGAYMVAPQEDWTAQSSFATDATLPPDIRTVTTITATATADSGPTAAVTYPIRYPPLATFAPASYSLIASVLAPSGLLDGFSSQPMTPPLALTGTLTGTALTGPFLFALMDTNTASEAWTFPSTEEGEIAYAVTPLVLTVPVSLPQSYVISARVDGTRARFIA